jgi:hypothetical protein
MFKCPVTALLPDQPPTTGFQAANDIANLHALVFRISVETHQRSREFHFAFALARRFKSRWLEIPEPASSQEKNRLHTYSLLDSLGKIGIYS